jgi:outer membrane protein assembly factor BamD
MKKTTVYIILLAFLLGACSPFEKIAKNPDTAFKYEMAKMYYEKKDYSHAISLLEDIAQSYKGTEQSEDVLYMTAMSYMGQKDYYSASNYFSTYVKTFPKGKHTEECRYMIGYCYYLDSPDARLDQTPTIQAITALSEFIEIYPESKYLSEAAKLIKELQEKLAYKAYLNARLYYNMGNYLGNNYLSAVITARNAIRNYPNTKYKEELFMIVLRSKYEQALQSVVAKRTERFTDTIDEYYNYLNEFPKGKYLKEAQQIFKISSNFVKN